MPSYRVLTGPTASGKTEWLLRRAATHPLVVISADSRQVYEHMDIGTGKAAPEELWEVRHFGVDEITPDKAFSAFDFVQMANHVFSECMNLPPEIWVCGGTGLYIRALVDKLPLGPPPLPRLRNALWPLIQQRGSNKIAADLGLDTQESSNPVRVLRKTEILANKSPQLVYSYVGLHEHAINSDAESNSTYPDTVAWARAWDCAGIYVLDPGADLEMRIAARVESMFNTGLLEEVARLRRLDYGECDVVRNGIAYKEAGLVLDGAMPLKEAITRATIRTRQYAKRQRTYFRGRGWPVYQNLDDLTL